MVNIDDFVKRLEILLEYYGLNASAFADKIGVQRSSMSHLLSGRNKPSLDFILKILEVFPEIDLYWILIGKGNFPDHDKNFEKLKSPTSTSLHQNTSENLLSAIDVDQDKKNIFPEFENKNINLNDDEIEKIVLFYKNGTFKAYLP